MTQQSILSVEFPEPDIAVLTIDDPAKSVNVLSTHVAEDFEKQLDALDQRDGLAGLVICSGKPGSFIAGADLREFVQWIDLPDNEVADFCRKGQGLWRRLGQCRVLDSRTGQWDSVLEQPQPTVRAGCRVR